MVDHLSINIPELTTAESIVWIIVLVALYLFLSHRGEDHKEKSKNDDEQK